jgi:hypothetical protein
MHLIDNLLSGFLGFRLLLFFFIIFRIRKIKINFTILIFIIIRFTWTLIVFNSTRENIFRENDTSTNIIITKPINERNIEIVIFLIIVRCFTLIVRALIFVIFNGSFANSGTFIFRINSDFFS